MRWLIGLLLALLAAAGLALLLRGGSGYLLLQGVSSSQLEIISYGEERPAQVGTTEQAYSLNRRVEMK